jgi:hypothetical protein
MPKELARSLNALQEVFGKGLLFVLVMGLYAFTNTSTLLVAWLYHTPAALVQPHSRKKVFL